MIGRGRRARVDPAFDRFLQAPFDEDPHQKFLTVVSVLARLDLDPWHEAAVLAQLSPAAATKRLVTLFEKLPNPAAVPRDAARTAMRLVELLPRKGRDPEPESESPVQGTDDMQAEVDDESERPRAPAGGRWSKSTVIALLLIVAAIAAIGSAPLDRWMGSRSPGASGVAVNPALGVDRK